MLAIQEFLRGGNTLQDVFQRFDINYTVAPDLGVVVFNYRMLSSLSDPLVAQSRGLVLEMDTWDVVAKSIDAFHEPDSVLGQKDLKTFDWKSAIAIPKFDGALVCLYCYKDQWHVSTRFSADGNWTVWSITSLPQSITWAQLTQMAIEDSGYTWDSFTKALDPEIFYTFELCAPENRVIVVYPERRIHLVAAIQKSDLKELDIFKLKFPKDKPPFYKVSKLEDVTALIDKNPAPHETEGFVVVDKNFKRLKVRNPLFVNMMRVKTASDDLTQLREIRMMDVNGSYQTTSGATHVTNVEVQPFSAMDIGTQTVEGKASREALSSSSMINRVMTMCRYIRDAHQAIKSGTLSDEEKTFAEFVWAQALQLMDSGQSMSEIMDITPEKDMRDALIRFETT